MLDAFTIEHEPIASIDLMERAAGAVARSVNRGGKTALTRAVKQEAARQLEAYQDLLGDQ